MSQCFPKPFRSFGGNINVKVDLSNYATKANIKTSASKVTIGFLKMLDSNLKNMFLMVVMIY